MEELKVSGGVGVTLIETESLGGTYPALLNYIEDFGATLESRGGAVKEVENAVLLLHEPECCIVGRKGFSREFLDLEVLMLLAGTYDAELTAKVAPRAADLVTPLTAYGPRTRQQLLRVVAELTKSPDSRRAVVYVGRDDDLQKAYTEAELRAGEMPCTSVWQFLLRDGSLDMTVYMRSWDAVWGLSYDVPCFVAVQTAVAAALRVPLGKYVHHAGSLHVYERHWGWEAWDNDDELVLEWVEDDLHRTQETAARLLAARKEME
jgi:hypothetical protein